MVKLVEPNYDGIVTFKVPNEEPFRQMGIRMLLSVANLDTIKATVHGNIVILKFPSNTHAEEFRQAWRKYS